MKLRTLAFVVAALLVTGCKKESAAPDTAAAPPAAGEEKVLNIYNWSDYIAPDTIAKF